VPLGEYQWLKFNLMSLPRFYIPPESWSLDALALTGDEANHCASVMRRSVGDEIIAFNGLGAWAKVKISASSKQRVDLEVIHHELAVPAPSTLSLLQAIPKGSNMELIIEKAVELGVSQIYPVMTERTVVSLDAKDAPKKQAKWQRLAIEACKQCGQNWLPQVHLPRRYQEALASLPAYDLKLIAALTEDARSFKSTLSTQPTTLLAIGPEGDFTPAEYALAQQAGFLPISLGPIILRVETATLFALSVLRYEMSA
jgi:16S rRNA (uracil1498-N3)-methyltransferase